MKKLLFYLAMLCTSIDIDAQVKVNALPSGTTPVSADFAICDQSGVTNKCTYSQVATAVSNLLTLGTFATQNYATPPAIGGTTPAAGAFSTLSATTAIAVTSGGTGTTTSTGTGSVVLSTSPTLISPALGTPSAVVLTNATGLPAAALPTFSGDCTTTGGSAVLTCTKTSGTAFGPAATIATTTGTGAVVLATSPTLVTPALGTPSAINLTNATALAAAALPAFTGDVFTSAGSSTTTISANAVTNAKAAQMAASSVKCNSTASISNASDCNPLQIANLQSAVISVDVITTTNITLSGLQTIDGVSLVSGQTVLVGGQTTTANNGIYVVASGAWPRAANFPSGYVIPQNCDLIILVRSGTAFSNTNWYVPTTSGSITIGTTGWSATAVAATGTSTRFGTVKTTVGSTVASFTGTVTAAADSASFQTTSGDVADIGDVNHIHGPGAVENSNTGHLVLQNGGFVPTSSVGTINANSTDHWGIVTGLTAATAVTITFATAYGATPACTANASVTSTPVAVSAISASAATFSMAALTGSLYYICFGNN